MTFYDIPYGELRKKEIAKMDANRNHLVAKYQKKLNKVQKIKYPRGTPKGTDIEINLLIGIIKDLNMI